MIPYLDAMSSLLWPLIVAVVAFRLLPHVSRMLAKSERVSVEVAGVKVSLERATEELGRILNEVQRELVSDVSAVAVASTNQQEPPVLRTGVDILWVDDRSDANLYERQFLLDRGFTIRYTGTTAEAMAYLGNHSASIVISDLVRTEGGDLILDAGIRLFDLLAVSRIHRPFVLYTSEESRDRMSSELRARGVPVATSSIDLLQWVTEAKASQ